jgi:hypothetical protein
MANVHRTFNLAVKRCRREGQHQVAEEFTRRSNILTGRAEGCYFSRVFAKTYLSLNQQVSPLFLPFLPGVTRCGSVCFNTEENFASAV